MWVRSVETKPPGGRFWIGPDGRLRYRVAATGAIGLSAHIKSSFRFRFDLCRVVE